MPLDNPKCVYHPDLELQGHPWNKHRVCRANIQLAWTTQARCKEDDTVQIQLLPVEHDKQP